MKSKRIIPIFFILILSLLPTLPFVESAGYGEENENLGQFVDDYENDDNVSVAVNVINNQTLDAMELNYTATAGGITIENFTTYTEVDIGADRITFTNDTHVVHYAWRDEDTYLYYDYGVGYFTDYIHLWAFRSNYRQLGGLSNIWTTSNTIDDIKGISDGGGNFISLRVYYHPGGQRRIILMDCLNGNVVIMDSYTAMLANTIYYFTANKTGTAISVDIYSDSARTVLVNNLAGTLQADYSFRYIYPIQTFNDGVGAEDITNEMINLNIGVPGPGYVPSGYFITEDYLNYTTGNSLALLTNASIPGGTSLTVQFSNDGTTWVDNEGNAGSTPIGEGFYAIDLRDLNYTDIYSNYTFSGTPVLTPRLYQSRLITTIGNVSIETLNITGEWIDYNLTEIDVLIGGHDSGDVNSTLDIDGDIFNCSEVVGAPGYRISFNWTNVDPDAHCLWVTAYVYYDGNQAHDIHIELYSFSSSSWIEIGTINDGVTFEWYNVSIYDLRMPNDFINAAGEVWGRFDHVAAGNINHDIHIEYLKLQAFIPFEAAPVAEDNFFWIFLAIALSMIVGIIVWLKYGDHDN